MSENNNIYTRVIPFIIVAAIAMLIGTVITVFVPMFTKEMHPKLADLEPYTAIELAGRNLYQKEGCFNCHTQTVRPLKADVLRYGDYSKAGENYYEHPFLWGSKRTGPDLSRIGMKYNNQWHIDHFKNPQAFYPLSNMPKYDFLANKPVDVEETVKSMKALGFPYTEAEINDLKNKTELDALVAYMQVIGTSVERRPLVSVNAMEYIKAENPLKDDKAVMEKGRLLFATHCAQCHGSDGKGTDIASAIPDLITPDTPQGMTFVTIANGLRGLMPEHINVMTKDDIWSIVTYVRSLAGTEPENQM